MATLQDIEKRAKKFADLRAKLADEVRNLNDEVEAAKRRHLSAIKRLVEAAGEAHGELHDAIAESPALFEKPKTQTLHGIRLGFQKGKGRIEWDDDEQVVALIRKHQKDDFDLLVKTEYTPVKKALAQLSVADLKRLGVEVEETGEVVFIKDTTTDIDKLVTALLKQETAEAEA